MVDPNSPVYTIADKDKAPYATVTFEKGIGFILGSDTYVNGHYEALIHMLKAGEWSTSPPVWGNCASMETNADYSEPEDPMVEIPHSRDAVINRRPRVTRA